MINVEIIDLEDGLSSYNNKVDEQKNDEVEIIFVDRVLKSPDKTGYTLGNNSNNVGPVSVLADEIRQSPDKALYDPKSAHTQLQGENQYNESGVSDPLDIRNESFEKKEDEPSAKKFKSSIIARKTGANTRKKPVPAVKQSTAIYINPSDCTYPKPPICLRDIIIMILRNCKCLTNFELWNFISGLFPYYEYHFDSEKGITKIRTVSSKFPSFFLKSDREVIKSNKKLLMLNPVCAKEQLLIMKNAKELEPAMKMSLFKPDLSKFLLNGTLSLSTVKLFQIRNKPENNVHANVSKKSTAKESSTLTGRTSAVDSKMLSNSNTLPTIRDEDDRSVSPTSDASTDTIVFDPQIIECCSLREDEVEKDLLTADDAEDSSESKDPGITKFKGVINLNSKFLVGQLDNMTFNPHGISSPENAFVNTVWSNDNKSKKKEIQGIEMSHCNIGSSRPLNTSFNNPPVSSFPEVDKCVPKWKEIFPWMMWNVETKYISCIFCELIHSKTGTNEKVNIMQIVGPDEVFKVSRLLRAHAEKNSHKMATVLNNKDIISTLHFLLNFHFSEFTSVSEIIGAFECLLGNKSSISQDSLKSSISLLGEYLEDRIIETLKKMGNFSVITDPCTGLLIVRWLNELHEPEEHIISSYLAINDKTPTEYLSSLGVDNKKMLVYVTNARCGECIRCRLTKKVVSKNSTPLRLPQLDRYLIFLWRTKLLKPFYSMGCTLCKLWLSFPHKFSDIGEMSSLDHITKFPSNPLAFLDIFKYFDKFKEIASSIYSLTGSLEALGFQTLEMSKYMWLLDMFPILSDINSLLMELKVVYPFSKNCDELFSVVEKLKNFCDKSKEYIKDKKMEILGVSASDIDDVFLLVDLTVKEFQQPIYHKGKSVPISYGRMTSYNNLSQYTNYSSIQNAFNILYTSLRPYFVYENTLLLSSLTNFLKNNKKYERKDVCVVLNNFSANPSLIANHKVVYEFYRHMALFAFQPAKIERCLYEIKVYEFLFYRSPWSSIGANIKEYLLTIISELSGKNKLSETDMYLWWKGKMK